MSLLRFWMLVMAGFFALLALGAFADELGWTWWPRHVLGGLFLLALAGVFAVSAFRGWGWCAGARGRGRWQWVPEEPPRQG